MSDGTYRLNGYVFIKLPCINAIEYHFHFNMMFGHEVRSSKAISYHEYSKGNIKVVCLKYNVLPNKYIHFLQPNGTQLYSMLCLRNKLNS